MRPACCGNPFRCFPLAEKSAGHCLTCGQVVEIGLVNGWCAACFADALGDSCCRCLESSNIRLTHTWTRPLRIEVLSPQGLVLLTTTIDVADDLGNVLRRLLCQSVAWNGYALSCDGQVLSDDLTVLDLRDMFETTADAPFRLKLVRKRKRPREHLECEHCGHSSREATSSESSASSVLVPPEFLMYQIVRGQADILLAVKGLKEAVEAQQARLMAQSEDAGATA